MDKRIKEFIALALITSVALLPIMASAEGAAINLLAQGAAVSGQVAASFSDVDTHHPYEQTIVDMKNRGFVSGNPDGSFKPDQSINRAELVTMVIASITKNPTGSDCFTDVHNEWFAPRVCEAKKRGIVSGYPDGSFKPFNNVNFVEAAQIIAKAHNLKIPQTLASQQWFVPAVSTLAELRAIPTTVDNVNEKLSRAETSDLILRLVEPDNMRASKTLDGLTSALPLINSCTELSDKITMIRYKNYRNARVQNFAMKSLGVGAMAEDAAVPPAAAPQPTGATAESAANGEAATEYSTTNVQVNGVDESDVIKNDGEFIYMVSGKTVRIVKAYQPKDMAQVSRLELSDENFTPSEIYNYGKKLVILGTSYTNAPEPQPLGGAVNKMMIYPGNFGSSRAKVFVVDMTDKSHLREERSVEFDGYTVSSRRIGSYVYLVVNKSPDYRIMYSDEATPATQTEAMNLIPRYKDSRIGKEEAIVPCASIRFMPDYDEMNMMTIASLNLDNPAAPVRKEVVMGAGDTVYASTNNLYVAATRYIYPTAQLFDVFAPVEGQEETRVIQFKLNGGDVNVGATGSVPGHILNQFAMDESANDFRIATTIGEVWAPRGDVARKARNNVYVLNVSDLGKRSGALENIAPGETIYSVRFLGDRAYMVTFKKVDPFFVIDLPAGSNPKLLGALKIPGFSNYLHPIDENHVLGFGKDAVDPSDAERASWWGDFDFAWYQGIKVAVFDVTDVTNPKLQSNLVIGDRGTDSELLNNHKALFFDKARGLIAFPVTINKILDKKTESASEYGTPIFQGAEVLKLSSDYQLSVAGQISHLPANAWDSPNNANSWWTPNNQAQLFIQRILSIGNYLYTVSIGHIRASNISDLSEVKSIDLEYDKSQGGWGWEY